LQVDQNNLSFDAISRSPTTRDFSTLPRSTQAGIVVTYRDHPGRERAQRFIEETYCSAYGSIITNHYPAIVSVLDDGGNILGAVGFRDAACETLFLEQYLSERIEQAVAGHLQETVSRDAIVEIGNLVSSGRGASALLFTALASYLATSGYRYAVVTATTQLRRRFERMGFETHVLGAADPTVLADNGTSWGAYYKCGPKVLVGAIPSNLARLGQFFSDSRRKSYFAPAAHMEFAMEEAPR
jgi:Thermostable hemolysin